MSKMNDIYLEAKERHKDTQKILKEKVATNKKEPYNKQHKLTYGSLNLLI